MLLKIHPDNPNAREINKAVDILTGDGVLIYPTDTVYAMGCLIRSKKAFERILQIKNMKAKDAVFSLICSDLSHLSDYAKVDNRTFKLLKKNLPGPFTFILPASGKVPDKLLGRRKQIGLRIPDNKIIIELVKLSEAPLLSTSIKFDDEIVEYISDPELIHEEYSDLVDACIDGGPGGLEPSTVVDCSGADFEIVRQGKGELSL